MYINWHFLSAFVAKIGLGVVNHLSSYANGADKKGLTAAVCTAAYGLTSAVELLISVDMA